MNDLSHFESSEKLIEYVRNRDSKATTSPGRPAFGNVQSTSGTYESTEREGRSTGQSFYRIDGSDESWSGDSYGSIDELSSDEGFSGTGYSGPHKRGRSVNRSAKRTWESVKQNFQPVKEALKKDPEKTPAKRVPTKLLTDVEIAKLKGKFLEMLTWQCEHMDQFLQATTKGHEEVVIWSDMESVEIEIFADFILSQGKTNRVAARYVRSMSTMMMRLKLSLISVPRAYKTIMLYWRRGISIW